jgi:hypothetical protein
LHGNGSKCTTFVHGFIPEFQCKLIFFVQRESCLGGRKAGASTLHSFWSLTFGLALVGFDTSPHPCLQLIPVRFLEVCHIVLCWPPLAISTPELNLLPGWLVQMSDHFCINCVWWMGRHTWTMPRNNATNEGALDAPWFARCLGTHPWPSRH